MTGPGKLPRVTTVPVKYPGPHVGNGLRDRRDEVWDRRRSWCGPSPGVSVSSPIGTVPPRVPPFGGNRRISVVSGGRLDTVPTPNLLVFKRSSSFSPPFGVSRVGVETVPVNGRGWMGVINRSSGRFQGGVGGDTDPGKNGG